MPALYIRFIFLSWFDSDRNIILFVQSDILLLLPAFMHTSVFLSSICSSYYIFYYKCGAFKMKERKQFVKSGPGVGLIINFPDLSPGDLGINLGGRDIRMAKHLLHRA